jgi:muramoyltetrapeptide carboxypeptidase
MAVSMLNAQPGAPTTTPLIRPQVLHSGDTVGLITPATYVSDPDKLQMVDRTIRYFGLVPRFGKHVGDRAGYLGGSVQDRLDDLHAMFADPSVKGVFAVRGGYGSPQLLDGIDYKLIAANPKIFIGYSDITAMHLAIHKMTGLVTLHGPVTTSEFTPFTQTWYRKALFEPQPLGVLTNPPETNPLRPQHTIRTIHPGKARGRIIGGNLSLVVATMGTPYEMDTRGRIVLLEDVDEQPYSIDRMLTQLHLAGKFDGAAGLVIGECVDCRPRDYKPAFESTFSLGEVLDRVLGKLAIPVFHGLTFGHTDDQLTLPEGMMAELDADKGTLTIEESATVA